MSARCAVAFAALPGMCMVLEELIRENLPQG